MPQVKIEGNKFTVELTYEETREKYLQQIREAQDLGETEEVARLQAEWQQKKTEFGK